MLRCTPQSIRKYAAPNVADIGRRHYMLETPEPVSIYANFNAHQLDISTDTLITAAFVDIVIMICDKAQDPISIYYQEAITFLETTIFDTTTKAIGVFV